MKSVFIGFGWESTGLLSDDVLHNGMATTGLAFFMARPYVRGLERILIIPCKIESSDQSLICGDICGDSCCGSCCSVNDHYALTTASFLSKDSGTRRYCNMFYSTVVIDDDEINDWLVASCCKLQHESDGQTDTGQPVIFGNIYRIYRSQPELQ